MAVTTDTATRLRRLSALGLSQTRIAAECGLSQPTVSNYLRGAHKSAREDVAKRVADAYVRLLEEHREEAN